MVSKLKSVVASDGKVFNFAVYGGKDAAEAALETHQNQLKAAKQAIDDKPS